MTVGRGAGMAMERVAPRAEPGQLLGARVPLVARRMLDEAIALLEKNPAEIANLASALVNRSFLHLSVGDVRRARADLTWCRRVPFVCFGAG